MEKIEHQNQMRLNQGVNMKKKDENEQLVEDILLLFMLFSEIEVFHLLVNSIADYIASLEHSFSVGFWLLTPLL